MYFQGNSPDNDFPKKRGVLSSSRLFHIKTEKTFQVFKTWKVCQIKNPETVKNQGFLLILMWHRLD